MEDLDRQKLGEELRHHRRNKGLRMSDLAIEGVLSTATISNIELGRPHVTIEKIELYCKQINYDLKKAPTITGEDFKTREEQQMEFNTIKITAAENLARLDDYTAALAELKEIDTDPEDPLNTKIYFLKARCFRSKGNEKKAIQYYEKTIRFINNNPSELNKGNVKAHCYLDLCQIAYYNNDFKTALKQAKNAFQYFDPDQGNESLKHLILANQIIYLELLDYREKAFALLKDLWKEKDRITNFDVILSMYDTQARILMKSELYQEAINYAKKGLNLAIANKSSGRAGELWTTLGSIYKRMDAKDIAIKCFQTAKNLLKKDHKNYQLLEVDALLGEIYNQKKQWRKTQRMLEQSIKTIDETSPYLIRYIQALIILGDSLFYLDEMDQCKSTYEKALKLSQKYELNYLEYKIQLKLTSLWEKTDDNEQFNIHLLKFLRKARELELKKGGMMDD